MYIFMKYIQILMEIILACVINQKLSTDEDILTYLMIVSKSFAQASKLIELINHKFEKFTYQNQYY